MRIDKILARVKAPESKPAEPEKTAAEKKPETAPAAALTAALDSALAGGTGSEKTAAQVGAGPVADVMKVAEEIAASEKEAAVKEARMLGEAFADAAIARIEAWQKTAQAVVAQPAQPAVAQPPPALLKQAAEIGYRQTQAELEKLAAAEYERGWNDTVTAIYKTAADEFAKAAQLTGALIQAKAA